MTLRRELTLTDVVFFDVCAIVSLRWVAAAAHAGAGSLILWVAAALFFFVPCAVTVSALSRQFPQQGGMYIWTKQAFGDRHAFLCSWFYFISTVLYLPSLLLAGISMAAYGLGAAGQHVAEERRLALPIALAVLWAAFVANFFGMKVAKWVSAFGGISTFVIGGLLALLAIGTGFHSGSATRFVVPPMVNLPTLNFWSQIAFAFVGLELAPIVSAEILDPGRDLPRAALISGAAATLLYIGLSSALLVLMVPEKINPMIGLAQAGVVGARNLGAPVVAILLSILIAVALAGQLDTWIAGNTRLPYAIGLDRYLPEAFGRTHQRWGTPYVSLFVQAIAATLFLLMAQLGETVAAAYQIMVDMTVIITFVPFLYIFAAGFRFASRIAAFSGFAVTLIAIVLSALPTPEVESTVTFEIKVLGGSFLLAALGWTLFRRYAAQRSRM